jgi:eukaryotic-like serine/threonine-protein kinase
MDEISRPDLESEKPPEAAIFSKDGFTLAEEMLAELAAEHFRPLDFDHYHFIGEAPLGRGNIGEVWLAEDKSLNRKVAIKFLLNSPDPSVWAKRETQLLGSLNHRYIAGIYSSGKLEDGTPWFSMEYVEGEQLDECFSKPARPALERLNVFHFVCEGVQYAHRHNVVHGDLKPSNIRVNTQGEPRLVDFGLADVIQSGPALGFTPAYAAPEQFEGKPVGIARDIYALGTILYELLSGTLPFNASTRTVVEIKDLKASGQPPERPSVVARSSGKHGQWSDAEWRDLDAICLKAIAAEESSRYSEVGDLLRDLDRFRERRPLEARQPHTAGYRLSKFLKRNRVQVSAATLVLVVIALLIAFFTLRLTAERDRALAEANRTRRVQQFLLDLFSNGDPQAAPSKAESVVTLLDRRAASLKQLDTDPETQTEYYSLVGRLYEQQFEYPKAERFVRLAVDKSRTLPAASRVAIEAAIQLALVRGDQAAFHDAESIAQEALRRTRLYFPPNNIVIAQAESALGRVMTQEGQYAKAIALLNTLVNRKLDGDQGDAILSESLDSLGTAQYQSGHWQEAEATYRRALEFDRKRGNSHPRVATDMANIATALSSKGDLAEAERLYLQAADIMSAWYGDGNAQTLQLKTFAALMALSQGKLAEAEELSNGLAPQLERAYGTAIHPNLAEVHDLLGKLALRKGDLPTAESELSTALNINRKLFPPNDLRITPMESTLANVLLKEGKYAAAEDAVRATVKVMAASPYAGKDQAALVTLMLGEAILKQRRYREAEPLLLDAYEILRKSTRKSYALYIMRSRADLIELYQALHQPDKIPAPEGVPAPPHPSGK